MAVELRLRRLILASTDAGARIERDAMIRRGAVPDPAVRDGVRTTLAEVIQQAYRGIDRVRRTPHLAYSFLRHAGLSVS